MKTTGKIQFGSLAIGDTLAHYHPGTEQPQIVGTITGIDKNSSGRDRVVINDGERFILKTTINRSRFRRVID